jgi:hypothetical protein
MSIRSAADMTISLPSPELSSGIGVMGGMTQKRKAKTRMSE